jgi:hypothetical protein
MDMIDDLLRELTGLASQGVLIAIEIQIGDTFIVGTVIDADTYRAELAQLIGAQLEPKNAFDAMYLHLRNARMSSFTNALYRCPISAVQGYVIYKP